ncbi:hypothetical protein APR50_10095 [Variovorax paradoxus]|nr:hypothetical protein APR49_38820 [Variovorax paradoxus]KPV09086.1 hypothetical protein APR50_10095 [Variovorax paradoxus]KPV33899.1 hypothetical protein APR48_08920 [Variovorax paradoxus]KPV37241.1 hypothetical protein APR47_08315 [Variovorax paradoxus]
MSVRRVVHIDFLQPIQDSAFSGHSIARLAQRLEFLLEVPQVTDALSHMLDVLIQNNIDGVAVFSRRILKAQQRADLLERHVQ